MTALIDIALAGGCATILWHSGGSTVIDGSWIPQILCVLLATVLLATRHTLHAAARDRNDGTGSIKMEQTIAGVDVLGVVVVTTAWYFSDQYFLGWIATFGALTLLLGSVWQFLGALVARPARPATPPPSPQPRSRGGVEHISLRAMTGIAGMGALLVLAEIHSWNPTILSGLIVLVSGAMLLAVVLRAWLTALAVQSPNAALGCTPNTQRLASSPPSRVNTEE